MADLRAGDYVLFTHVGSMFGQTILNTFTFKVTTEPAVRLGQEDVLEDLTDLMIAPGALFQKVLNCSPSEFGRVAIWAQVIAPVRFAKFSFADAAAGQADGVASTANLAGVVTRRAERAGRKQVGSVHLPIATDVNGAVNGIVSEGVEVALEALALALPTSYTTAGYTIRPVIGVAQNADGTDRWVVSGQWQRTARVMRRRTLGLGI